MHVLLAAVAWPVLIQAQDRHKYIEQYRDIAIREMHRTGIPASIKLAQGILESNAGASDLAKNAHNHFGIKCGGDWNGKTYHKKDDDRDARGVLVASCFRAFRFAEESYVAHSEFLRDPSRAHRYGSLFRFAPDDYQSWAHGLSKAGYATNPRYAQLLIGIIEQYGLHTYDARKPRDMAAGDREHKPPAHRQPVKASRRQGQAEEHTTSLYTIQYQNDVPYITATGGENAKAISQYVQAGARRIARINESIEHHRDPIGEGERVYLQPLKRKFRGDQRYHVVHEGETLESIAHFYAVKAHVLRRNNGIADDCEPATGVVIALRGKLREPVRCRESVQPLLAESLTLAPLEEDRIDQEAAYIELSIPVPESDTHTVQPGDTLYQIARTSGVPVGEIKKLNNLSGDTIYPGQVLRLRGE